VLQRAKPAIRPVGESRSNVAVFGELCRRLGLSLPGEPEREDEVARAVLRTAARGRDLEREIDERAFAFPDEGEAPVQFVDAFPRTSDRKISLLPEALEREAPLGLYRYRDDPATAAHPLALVSPSSEKTVSSTFGQLVRKPARVEIHPADAAARGIADGALVSVFNEGGEVRCEASVTDAVRPGVVSLAKGLWARHTRNGWTSNALAPDTLTGVGGGACFNDARVEVRPV
jgi:anaerobic selenocysteine-containing dehydrogenase